MLKIASEHQKHPVPKVAVSGLLVSLFCMVISFALVSLNKYMVSKIRKRVLPVIWEIITGE